MSSLSDRHEREIAEKLGGVTTLASGAVREPLDVWTGQPGDNWRLIVSAKSTIQKGLRVTASLWDEAEAASVATGLRPALAVRIYERHTPVVDLVAVSVDDMAEMLWHLRERRG